MGPLTPIIGLRLLALAAGLRHNAEFGQPPVCFSAYGHKFGINHLAWLLWSSSWPLSFRRARSAPMPRPRGLALGVRLEQDLERGGDR